MVTRTPPHEIFEAAAWMAGPLALIGIAIWVIVGRRANRRAARFAAEDIRIDEQAREQRQAAWRISQTSPTTQTGDSK